MRLHLHQKKRLTVVHCIGLCLTAGFLMAGCNDKFMDRYPQSSISPQAFFNTEADLKQYTNSFYDMLPGESIYQADASSDNVDPQAISDLMAGTRTVPVDASTAGWTWGDLRNINYFLEQYAGAVLDDSTKEHYAGVARFFRALFYFNKVQRFGDVPWYSGTLGTNSDELYKARDSRQLVIDSVVADLDFAIAHLRATKDNSYVSRWAALALKSRVCLYEGTYRKYHTDLGLSETAGTLLQQAADAAYNLLENGGYSLYNTGHPQSDYGDLFALDNADPGEVILAHGYSATYNIKHFANAYFNTSTLGAPGLTQELLNSYLTSDGKPFSTVSGWETMEFTDEVKDRDPRLAQTIRTPGYTRRDGTTVLIPDFTAALTGYQCIKFVTGSDQDAYYANTNDLPVIRLAEVMLNYAEARAELDQLTQQDVALSLNPIRERAGLPDFDLANVPEDPILEEQYVNASDPLILAIRRERRIELAMEGFRRQDMLRWKEGAGLAKDFHGMYFAGYGYKDFSGDGISDFGVYESSSTAPSPVSGIQYLYIFPSFELTDGSSGYLNIHPSQSRGFNELRDYLDPLPTNELLLNTNLQQNPNWK